ncbi:DUF333 domain-containing protein [bacterium]|nr:DUF333 domain-containing protein [bacterium]
MKKVILFSILILLFSFNFVWSKQRIISIPESALKYNPVKEVIPIEIQKISPVEIEQEGLNVTPNFSKSPYSESGRWCKNLCGDGICQEITCMAIGCPCPETPKTCPEDCGGLKNLKQKGNEGMPNPAAVYCKDLGYKYEIREDPKTKGQYGVCIFPDGSKCNAWAFYRGECGKKWQKENKEKPVVVFPPKKRIIIDPKREKPILIEGKSVEFKGAEKNPDISFEVKAKEKPVSVKIGTSPEKKRIEIRVKDKVAITKEMMKFEENKLKIKTSKKEIEVNVLPDKAIETVQEEIPEVRESELKVKNDKPIYEIRGEKRGKLLFIFPVRINLLGEVNAQTAEVLKIKKPWWSFLVF